MQERSCIVKTKVRYPYPLFHSFISGRERMRLTENMNGTIQTIKGPLPLDPFPEKSGNGPGTEGT